jgi:hypothetical protein
LPTLLTLLVPYPPTRYTHTRSPASVGWSPPAASAAIGSLRGVARRLAGVAAGTLALTVLAAGALTVRADLADYARVSAAHRRVLDQARAIADTVGSGAVVAVVRGERNDPLREIALSVHGLPKLFFPRPDDPDGLVDVAALFEWVLDREGTAVRRLDVDPLPATSGVVLTHGPNGFAAPVAVTDVAAASRAWRARGLAVRLIRAMRLDRRFDAAVTPGASAPAP